MFAQGKLICWFGISMQNEIEYGIDKNRDNELDRLEV